ncbi:MAG: VOC family protein [Planctomycetia bacterium]|nr:VOC family protein [Planctomycetia bacterium]
MAEPKPGAWCHIEIPTTSPKKAKDFYGALFGWTFRDVPELNYVIFSTGEGGVGGGLWNPPQGIPRQITNYVLVEDVRAMADKVVSLGGKTVTPRTEVPGHGWFALVADPDGNVLGLWQSAPRTAPAPAKRASKKPAKPGKRARTTRHR